MKRYWPLLLIVVILAAIMCMSQYADSAKERYEEATRQMQSAPVAKDNNGEAADNAEKPQKPPVWGKWVAFPEGVGAWAVILTLLAIAWQSIETSKAARGVENQTTELAVQNRNMVAKERARLAVAPPEDDILMRITQPLSSEA
jgi:hypothetical protein